MDLRNQKEVKESNNMRNTSTEKEILYGNTEGKQVVPISRGNTQCQGSNITDGSKEKSICTMAKNKEGLLAKIKLMAGEQMAISSNDFFNQEVEHLKRRAGQVECTKTHKEIVQASLQKVSDLEKELEALQALQEETSAAVPVPQVDCRDRHINACLETAG